MTTDTVARGSKTAARPPKAGSPSANQRQRKTVAATNGQTNAERVRSWLRLSREDLDDIYRKSRSGGLPHGDTRGTPIFAGWPAPRWLPALARSLGWQGKVFDLLEPNREAGVVVNKVTPFGLNLIVAKVYRGESWLDGKDTIVIDYSRTSLLARAIRDEIREVSPGLYLGKVWLGKRRILDFALELPDATGSRGK